MYKIGFVDSGIGGLIFAMDFLKATESDLIKIATGAKNEIGIVHFGDTVNVPYGLKTPQELYKLSYDIINLAASNGAKVVLVACNTAATVIDQTMLDGFATRGIKVITIIEKSAQALYDAALSVNESNEAEIHVAVLGTKQTIGSKKYTDAITAIHKNSGNTQKLIVHPFSPVEWEQRVEHGIKGEQIRETVLHHLGAFQKEICESFAKISAVGLFCTHYPYFKAEIYNYFAQHSDLKSRVQVVSQGAIFKDEVASLVQSDITESSAAIAQTTIPINSYITGNDLEAIRTVTSLMYPNRTITFSKI